MHKAKHSARPIHPVALFRLSVLGPLASREHFSRGELKQQLGELAEQTYQIPQSNRVKLSPKTIERWYYLWQRAGIEGLAPKARSDKGLSQIESGIQALVLTLKKEKPSRSLNSLIAILESSGHIAKGGLTRASLHRFLKQHALSRRTVSDANTIERRRFVAQNAGDIWQGDVMHGPMVTINGVQRKVYLVSFMDDASRLLTHSAFYLGETALDIEHALKQAVLKRGLPKRIILDNGAAYRSSSLLGICARLEIRLVFCKPYEPQGKGKLERWHRTVREQFLNELTEEALSSLDGLNTRLWSWVERVYHRRAHSGLEECMAPLTRWQVDLNHVRPLGNKGGHIDDIFYHRCTRKVKKDGTISWDGKCFEVPYQLTGQSVTLVIDPHAQSIMKVESQEGQYLGAAHPLDAEKNCHRERQRPTLKNNEPTETSGLNAVELAREEYEQVNRCISEDESDV